MALEGKRHAHLIRHSVYNKVFLLSVEHYLDLEGSSSKLSHIVFLRLFLSPLILQVLIVHMLMGGLQGDEQQNSYPLSSILMQLKRLKVLELHRVELNEFFFSGN